MRVRVGTSGYAYPEWKGNFYPEQLPAAKMLEYYAERLDTVEINNTFYRLPTEKLLAGWAERVPADFSLVLKASRRITHVRGFEGIAEPLDYLLRTAAVLGGRLGPMLFQFPPWFKKDLARLGALLALVPRERPVALEFRSSSWFDEEVYATLREHGVALVVSDREAGDEPPIVPTASHGYLRLRRASYGDEELARWGRSVVAQPWSEAHVFFKHEEEGAAPRMAARFRELLARSG
jgi:uncharacterized protein YecE (DUF72 family)